MSYLAMLKAARLCTKETKKDSSSPLPFRNDEGAITNKTKLRKQPWQPTYAYPWPDAVPGLGPRSIGPFESCVGCGRGSWVRYGGEVRCCSCAIARLEPPEKGLPW
jgi:hypothetical protein